MNPEELKSLRAPIKAKYREQPAAALVTLRAEGRIGEGVTCRIETGQTLGAAGYLKLSVAGHVTIFLTRTRGPFWSIRPALISWIAALGTQIVATLIAVYGLFMTPLGWGWALFVWGYAVLWFLVNDRLKLAAYRNFDPATSPIAAGP